MPDAKVRSAPSFMNTRVLGIFRICYHENMRNKIPLLFFAIAFFAALPIITSAQSVVLDSSFTPPTFNATPYQVEVQSNGKIIVAGNFTAINGATTSASRIARLNADGTHDLSFNPDSLIFNNQVRGFVLLPDDKIVAFGNFTTFGGVAAGRILRLNPDGTRDNTFNAGTGFNNTTYHAKADSSGRIVFVGNFGSYNGSSSARVARINADGTLDQAFAANTGTGFPTYPGAVLQQADGKIVIGGTFGTFNGTATPSRIVRLNEDGTLDESFYLGTTAAAGSALTHSMLQLPNNKILIASTYTSYDGVSSTTASSTMILLNEDGTRDVSFPPGSGLNIFAPYYGALDLDSNNKILAAAISPRITANSRLAWSV